MAGHSKWKNIMHRKGKTDAQRAKIFTKIGREMMVAIREGGADPLSNSKLRDLIAKAKQNNVPNDNIDRLIKKALGTEDKNSYESILYEGYGPNGVAILVETLTDNKNRTAGELRHFFDKYGGNLGTSGCVSYLFLKKCVIIVQNHGYSEDKVMEDGLSIGAEDFALFEDVIEFEAEPIHLHTLRDGLNALGYTIVSAELMQIPSTFVTLTTPEHLRKMQILLDSLEESDDVQQVFHNWENEA